MIEWPSDRVVTEDAKRALELFKKSSFCAELSEDGGTWRFRAWARSPDAPARMVLRNDANEARIYSREATGIWRAVHDQDAK